MRYAAAAVALVTLGLTGCATGEAPAQSPTTAPGDAATASRAAAGCAAPPATPRAAKSYAAAPDPATARGKTFTATVRTTCGDIVLELDGARAPQTVASFQHLARDGYWRDSPCHRLTGGGSLSVLQCGDPTGRGDGDPGYGFGVENVPADGSFPTGTVAMARGQDPSTNGGQFFLVYADSTIPPDYGGYTIFGKVVGGMDVLRRVASAGTAASGDGPPNQPISIRSVTVTEKKA